MLAKIAVTAAGLLFIILVNWYFLFSRGKSQSSSRRETGKK
jgi:plastocyanin domain-containing protein